MDVKIEEMTMEQAFDALQELLDRMDSEELALEESFKLYEQGLKLVRACHDRLDLIEKQLIVLEEQDTAEGENE